jgi:hypothetical protein
MVVAICHIVNPVAPLIVVEVVLANRARTESSQVSAH